MRKEWWVIGGLLCYLIFMHSSFFMERGKLWHEWEDQFKVEINKAHGDAEHLKGLIAQFETYQQEVKHQREIESEINAALLRSFAAGRKGK